ncbi:MAG: hypothetical protein ACP5FQ_07910, partial [Thermoplasmata archaeon]
PELEQVARRAMVPLPEERMQIFGKVRITARVLLATDSVVVLQHAGREKLLDVSISPEQRQTLKALEGQRVELRFGDGGVLQQIATERAAPGQSIKRGGGLGDDW